MTMQNGPTLRRMALRWTAVLALGAFAYGVYRAYRWAEPSPAALQTAVNLPAVPTQTLTLENVNYASFANGGKSWSVHADRIEAQRAPGNSAAGLQQATLTGIRSGKLYATPDPGAHTRTAGLSDQTPAGPPVATFEADSGRYAANASDALPADLRLLYSVYWQFQLTGRVRLKTSKNERLTAPVVTVLEMHNYHTGRVERRIVCDQGAEIVSGNVSIHANAIRFDPDSRQVECLGGVRGVLQGRGRHDTVQTDSAYWSLRDHMLRCPGAVTGTGKNGIRFIAQDMTLDTHSHNSRGAALHLTLPRRSGMQLPLPSLLQGDSHAP